MSFRDNLQYLRATRNMTQEQLAMLLGVSRQSVTKWEAERSYPEMDKLIKICQLFDCTLDDLVRGDLAQTAAPTPGSPTVPAGPPQDVCGYDEHQRAMAWKVPTGIACILSAVGIAFLFEGALSLAEWNGKDGLFVLIVLAGVLAGLAFCVPAGMAHTAFVKKHPYIEDFYTEEDRARARTTFSRGLIAGIGLVFAGIGCLLALAENPATEGIALCLLMLFVAAGTWSIVHVGMLLGRTNVAEYNKNAADELEIEDIMNAQVDQEVKDALLGRKKRTSKTTAVCGAIMIVATIVGMALLFAPLGQAGTWADGSFNPEGTTAMWFWLAWPVGGLLCGIVALLMQAFGEDE